MARQVYKEYNQGEILLFPPSIESMVPQDSPARLVDYVIKQLDIHELLDTYKGGGTSSYHPRMLLKVIFFAYMNNVYSCRKIARQLRENVLYIWLAGGQQPDFRTINNFRSHRLKDTINKLFTQVVLMLCEMGCLSLNELYVDGTKIESRANRYTFVWRKSTERYKDRLTARINGILRQIEEGIAQDNNEPDDDPTTPIDRESIKERIERINRENLSREQKKQVREIENKMLPKLEEYDRKLETLGDRNSYSKTDPDATFMRLKEDAMNNGQTKPAYNLQIGTSRQFITVFGLYTNPTDTLTLPHFVDKFIAQYGKTPGDITADSGYGSEENYEYLRALGITPYVKYNYFHKEQHAPMRDNPFLAGNMHYNMEHDYYVCPMGQHMRHTGSSTKTNEHGFKSYIDHYKAANCQGCPLRSKCHTAKGERVIAVNHRLDLLRREARELLMSEEGLRHRSRRPIEPEAVFGQMKFNMVYKRFRHVGKKLCHMDFGIFAIAFNLLKLSRLKGFKWDDFLRRRQFIASLCRYLVKENQKKTKVIKFERMERRWEVENAA